jgi:hypothetical protein
MKRRSLEVYQKAVAMAQSGDFRNWKEIEKVLTKDGFKYADDLLDGEKIRAVLDILWERAKAAS